MARTGAKQQREEPEIQTPPGHMLTAACEAGEHPLCDGVFAEFMVSNKRVGKTYGTMPCRCVCHQVAKEVKPPLEESPR